MQKTSQSPFLKGGLAFWVLFILFVFALTAGLIFFLRQRMADTPLAEKSNPAVLDQKTETQKESVPALETEKNSAEKYQSENFQISYISFGGDTALASGDAEKLPIEVFAVKSEPFLSEKENESKIAVSWKSNKLTISELTYSLAGGGATQTVTEDDFGFNHSIVLDSLEAGSPYIFSIKSSDRWGNFKSFGYYGAYSSAKADSIFELIGKTFGETFGWALGK